MERLGRGALIPNMPPISKRRTADGAIMLGVTLCADDKVSGTIGKNAPLTNSECEANALLMAAAPDMLEALHDHEDSLIPLSQSLRELHKLLSEGADMEKETHWMNWLDKQADLIEAALSKALS